MPDEFYRPARSADARRGQPFGRCTGNPPARRRRRQLGQGTDTLSPPPARQEGGGAAGVSGELEPAARGHVSATDLADDGGERAVPQAILHQRQHVLVLASLGKEDASGGSPACSSPGA